ncbi:hypothetical protein GLX27_003265 [Malassezia furfur]|uniref:Uncharacterized protein n=1 Tax=Malassezia furfur TaxID=55194 RepID=A0ABY8ESL8_MALFU|nr:hypothetical protein GLX27_003265 [Malassezia furfur]
MPRDVVEARTAELEALVRTIRAQRLRVTSRVAPNDASHLWVFVNAPDDVLVDVRERERVHDFLSGVVEVSGLHEASKRYTFGAVYTDDGGVISPADRVRYVHHLLTAMPRDRLQGRRDELGGAGLTLRHAPFPHLVDMMPVHDRVFDAAWIKAWANVSLRSVMLGISDDEIDRLRFHFGEQIALYFAFLNTYFMALAPAAMLGLVFFVCNELYNPAYSVALTVWACMFVEVWRLRERRYAVRWGTTGVRNVAEPRAAFRPRTVERDAVTGEQVEVFEWWRRELRVVMASLPVVAVFVVLLFSALTVIFFIEVIVAEVYDGPGQHIVPLVPTILFSTCIPALQAAWQAVARLLTDYENHATVRSYNASLTLKIFGLQSLVAYGGLVLTAYVYIPFGERLMQALFARGYLTRAFQLLSRQPHFQMPAQLHFTVHPARLHDQLFALCVTGQVMNTVSEVLVPIVLRALVRWKARAAAYWAGRRRTRSAHRVSFASDQAERTFLQRVGAEFALPTYDLFVDYAEMGTQFGTIALWSTIWPLAPVMGYVNNWFELRSDAYKIVVNMRRPVPVRTETIGSWLEVLASLVRVGVFTNASLVYLFEAQHKGAGLKRAVHTTLRVAGSAAAPKAGCAALLPGLLPDGPAARALVSSFLVALVCEQAYQVLAMVVHHVLTRIVWRDSAEERAVRRMQYENRVSLVERLERTREPHKHVDAEKPYAPERPPVDERFWDAASDVGTTYLAQASKAA